MNNNLTVIESEYGGEKSLFLVVSIDDQKFYGKISINAVVDTNTPLWELVIKDTAKQLLKHSGFSIDIEDLDYFYFGGNII